MGIGLLISASRDISTYATFGIASNSQQTVKVVGQLVKGKAVVYDPAVDPNYFSFYLSDGDGVEHQVVHDSAPPQDFEKSEQVVVTGKMEGGVFRAKHILTKCPSKYKEEELFLKSKQEDS